MQILNAYSCLSEGRNTDRKQKGFTGDSGHRYTQIMTAWVSPYVCNTFAATLRVDEELSLKGRQQRSEARCDSGWLWPAGIMRIISANLFPSLCVLLLTSFVLNYSSPAHMKY